MRCLMGEAGVNSPLLGAGWPERSVPGSVLWQAGLLQCPGSEEATLEWPCWGMRRDSGLLVGTATLEYTAAEHWG